MFLITHNHSTLGNYGRKREETGVVEYPNEIKYKARGPFPVDLMTRLAKIKALE